ncbi:MAG: hypothetical protein NT062_26860, partial [Proteobacteria bacterium]|nr:hypothetical protein [Pseudomonadota bacterium]
MANELATLWREAIANPDDDAVREVLADALQAAGDPRGELMSLQLLPADPDQAPARRDRIRELVARHGKVWLGGLAPGVTAARFDRGLVTRVELVHGGSVDAGADVAANLAQVREVAGAGGARLATDPRMIALRAIELEVRTLDVLDRLVPTIAHVAIMLAPGVPDDRQVLVDRVLPWCGARARITELTLGLPGFDLVRNLPWVDRLTRLTLVGGVRRGLALRPQLPAHVELAIVGRPGLDTCHVAYPGDYAVVLQRDGVARISGEWLLHPLGALAELPPDITRLELEDTSEPIVDRIRELVLP